MSAPPTNMIPAMGFINSGAICYFNSLLQCLFSSRSLVGHLREANTPHADLFRRFLENIANDQWDRAFTTMLLQTLGIFQPNQSSSEYFLNVMDRLQWDSVFQARYHITSQCEKCGHQSESNDITFNPLIDHSFNELGETSDLVVDVKCDGCSEKTSRKRSRRLKESPVVWAISLNKYLEKRSILYPPEFQVNEHTYRLVGLIDHFGVLGGGHYVSRVKRDTQHIVIDDERVHPITEEIFYKMMP